jgi:hypothetical protein
MFGAIFANDFPKKPKPPYTDRPPHFFRPNYVKYELIAHRHIYIYIYREREREREREDIQRAAPNPATALVFTSA